MENRDGRERAGSPDVATDHTPADGDILTRASNGTQYAPYSPFRATASRGAWVG